MSLVCVYKEGEIYNMTIRGYCNGRFPNGNIFLEITLCFLNGCTKFNKKACYCKHLGCDCFATNFDSLIHLHWHLYCFRSINFFLCYLFSLIVPNNDDCLYHKLAKMAPLIPLRLYKIHYPR